MLVFYAHICAHHIFFRGPSKLIAILETRRIVYFDYIETEISIVLFLACLPLHKIYSISKFQET